MRERSSINTVEELKMMPAAAAKQESGGNEENISSWNSTWSRLKDPRIVRVSRAMGGKDRHSKVCTVRGLRDRRVRLSVPTAIQLYDLQARLGLNQPSKVVDWLLNAAKNEIDELPPLQIPQGISFSQMLINPSSSSSSQKHHHHHHHHSTNFDKFKDVGGETNTHHHQSWTTSTDQNEYELENNFVSRQNNIPSSSASSSFSSHPFIDSFGRWDPASNLTLSHTPISLGLTAQHQDFSINASHHQQQQQQVLVYQPYFVPQMNMNMNMNMNAAALFDSKHPSFHASEISAASSSLTTATVRPFSFNMTTTADLLPSQRNAVDDDDLHSS